MSNEPIFFLVDCERDAANTINDLANSLSGARSQVSETKKMSGTAVEWIVFGTAALGAVTQLLELITKLIEQKKTVTTVKIGELEIKNPSQEDIEYLKKKYPLSKD